MLFFTFRKYFRIFRAAFGTVMRGCDPLIAANTVNQKKEFYKLINQKIL